MAELDEAYEAIRQLWSGWTTDPDITEGTLQAMRRDYPAIDKALNQTTAKTGNITEGRKFAYNLLSLPCHRRNEVVRNLGLMGTVEAGLSEIERIVVWVERAKAEGKMDEFKDAVAKAQERL